MFGADLVEKAKSGDKKALEQLYTENFKNLYRFVRHKVNTNEQCEDICCEAFLKAFENINKFNNGSTFKSWLFTIANNLVIDFYRKKKEVNVDEESFDFPQDDVIEGQGAGVKKQNSDGTEKLVKAILEQLPENYRQVLEYRFLSNMNIKETAELMEVSTNNVKVLQNRALKKAQTLFKTNFLK